MFDRILLFKFSFEWLSVAWSGWLWLSVAWLVVVECGSEWSAVVECGLVGCG